MIYDNVCRLAEKRGLTIQQLEKKAGLGNGVVCKWRTYTPRVRTLKAVADALGVTVNTLLREEKQEREE